MYKAIIIISLFISLSVGAQTKYTPASADTVTYGLYLKGDWDKLLVTGNEVLKQKIDFKTLRQRMGYAYFMKAAYYESIEQYQKAYKFDQTDEISSFYLYYNNLCLGNEQQSRFYARFVKPETQQYYHFKKIKILDALDFEYNYKTGYSDRGAPNYLRAGLNTLLGYRFSLYQAFSNYTQTQSSGSKITQNEYFISLDATLNSKLSLQAAYHGVGTKADTASYPASLFCGSAQYQYHRITLGLSASVLSDDFGNYGQYGVHIGATLPGKRNIRLKSSLYSMQATNNNRLVFAQTAGLALNTKLWLEGKVTLGNLKNYVDLNGLYLYNSIDPTTFRSGLSLFWTVKRSITLFGNYTFDTKNNTDTNLNYYQHSFSGGIIWKL